MEPLDDNFPGLAEFLNFPASVIEVAERRTRYIKEEMPVFLEWLRSARIMEPVLATVPAKANFREAHAFHMFNEPQVSALNGLLYSFEGKLTSSKRARINRCSRDTATRDIRDLNDRGISVCGYVNGRSTIYNLVPARS